MCIYIYICNINIVSSHLVRSRAVHSRTIRPRENMVGVDMVLAQYPQHTLYHRIYIIHD